MRQGNNDRNEDHPTGGLLTWDQRPAYGHRVGFLNGAMTGLAQIENARISQFNKLPVALDLPNVRVLGVERSSRGYTITVESTLKGTHCQRCGRGSREKALGKAI